MKHSEGLHLRERASVVSLSIILALGISACGDDDNSNKEQPAQNKSVEIDYNDDGTRSTELHGGNFESFCDGQDLIDVKWGAHGGGISRSADHAACEDGRLTLSDFALKSDK